MPDARNSFAVKDERLGDGEAYHPVIYSKARGRGVGCSGRSLDRYENPEPPRKKARREKHGSKDLPLQRKRPLRFTLLALFTLSFRREPRGERSRRATALHSRWSAMWPKACHPRKSRPQVLKRHLGHPAFDLEGTDSHQLAIPPAPWVGK
jgi:hypothetical protein